MDVFESFKAIQKQMWSTFAPLEAATTPPAGRLVRFARIRPGEEVLDVACGTGVVAVTAARAGAKVVGLDLTPELLDHARVNSASAGVEIRWLEGDAERLPLPDASFDAVVSQFGHMFAPRPEVTVAEMLRVLRPGGTIAFSTWPPELLTGRIFELIARYSPPPPPGIEAPVRWGDAGIVRERLADRVRDLCFHRAELLFPALSPQHFRKFGEQNLGPMQRVVESLGRDDPAKLATLRAEYDAVVAEYWEENWVHQGYLMTRATKRD